MNRVTGGLEFPFNYADSGRAGERVKTTFSCSWRRAACGISSAIARAGRRFHDHRVVSSGDRVQATLIQPRVSGTLQYARVFESTVRRDCHRDDASTLLLRAQRFRRIVTPSNFQWIGWVHASVCVRNWRLRLRFAPLVRDCLWLLGWESPKIHGGQRLSELKLDVRLNCT
jgi:hypothetical protein